MLEEGTTSDRLLSLQIIWNVLSSSDDTRADIDRAGLLPSLIRLVVQPSPPIMAEEMQDARCVGQGSLSTETELILRVLHRFVLQAEWHVSLLAADALPALTRYLQQRGDVWSSAALPIREMALTIVLHLTRPPTLLTSPGAFSQCLQGLRVVISGHVGDLALQALTVLRDWLLLSQKEEGAFSWTKQIPLEIVQAEGIVPALLQLLSPRETITQDARSERVLIDKMRVMVLHLLRDMSENAAVAYALLLQPQMVSTVTRELVSDVDPTGDALPCMDLCIQTLTRLAAHATCRSLLTRSGLFRDLLLLFATQDPLHSCSSDTKSTCDNTPRSVSTTLSSVQSTKGKYDRSLPRNAHHDVLHLLLQCAQSAENHLALAEPALELCLAIMQHHLVVDGDRGDELRELMAVTMMHLAEEQRTHASILQSEVVEYLMTALDVDVRSFVVDSSSPSSSSSSSRLGADNYRRTLSGSIDQLNRNECHSYNSNCSARMATFVLNLLANLCDVDDEKAVQLVHIASMSDLLDHLLSILRSGLGGLSSESHKELVCLVLFRLSVAVENKELLRKKGVIPVLVALMVRGTEKQREYSTGALWRLAMASENKLMIVREAQALVPLVHLLQHGSERMKEYAAGAVWSLGVAVENKTAVRKAGALPLLVQLLNEGTAQQKEHAAGALWTLSAVSTENKTAVRAAGAVGPLVRLLSHPAATEKQKEHVAGALWNVSVALEHKVFVLQAGAVPPLLALLSADGSTTKQVELAAGALMNLAVAMENKLAMRDYGVIPVFVRLLTEDEFAFGAGPERAGGRGGLSARTMELVVGALGNLAIAVENKLVLKDAGAIPPLVHLVRKQRSSVVCDDGVRDEARRCLRNLASNLACRSAMKALHLTKKDIDWTLAW